MKKLGIFIGLVVIAVIVISVGTYGIMRYSYNEKFDYTFESIELGGIILPYEHITTIKITNNSEKEQTPKIIVEVYDVNGKSIGNTFKEAKLDSKETGKYIITINCGNSRPYSVKISIRRYNAFL